MGHEVALDVVCSLQPDTIGMGKHGETMRKEAGDPLHKMSPIMKFNPDLERVFFVLQQSNCSCRITHLLRHVCSHKIDRPRV